MSNAVDARLSELLGGDFKSQRVTQVLETTAGFYPRDDVSVRDLLWVYEHLLEDKDCDETRGKVASQMNERYGDAGTREKAVGVVRLLSEGNPMYEDITAEKVFTHLVRPLQEIVVRQEVYSRERMRVASDYFDQKAFEERVQVAMRQRFPQPKIKN